MKWTAWNIIKLVTALFFGLIVYRCTTAVSKLDIDAEKAAAALAGATNAVAPPVARVERAGCKASDFTVDGVKMRREYDYIIFTGTIKNSSAFACGVQLRASTFDKADAVLDTSNFWPASIRNIAPGAAEPFKYMHRYDKAATNYDIVPIDAKEWKR